jgi:hypothetical protein
MNDYRFHWWPAAAAPATTPHVALAAPSTHHGAALALRHFAASGCDLGAPGAHVDITDAHGNRHTLLVEEVLDWLKEPEQAAFVEQERLAPLLEGEGV